MGGELCSHRRPGGAAVKLRILGVSHHSAPIEVRERLAIAESRIAEASLRLAGEPGVQEALVLSTCNRVELIACGESPLEMRAFIADYFGLDPASFAPYLYELSDRDAIRHVFRVASSLDSMVVGEPQILGQVKEAYAAARGIGAVRSQLDALLTRSFAVAKRVRTGTQIGSSAVSIASVAVDLAKKIFGSLEGKSVYLIGAGKMSELAAKHLIAHGADTIFVANRTHERAMELAERFGGKAIFFHDLYEIAAMADIVITSTGATHAIFRKEHGQLFLHKRKNRPMFFIDIAVPRDVAPEMNDLDGVFVYDIDDLQSVVAGHVAGRRREAERAEQIIEEEVARFMARVDTLAVVPTIISLQEQLETIRQAEIDKVRGRLGKLSPEQELAIESLTRGIVNKVLHTPITALKSAVREKSRRAEATTLIELIRRIFNLDRSKSPDESEVEVKR
jgi:glutamyl-tRNA reductase